MNNRLLGKVPTPLELVDTALDSVAEVAQMPARLGSNLFGAGQRTLERVSAAIEKPKAAGDVPAPPDVVLRGGLEAVSGVASGVVEGIGGIFNAFQQTADGVRRQIDGLVKP